MANPADELWKITGNTPEWMGYGYGYGPGNIEMRRCLQEKNMPSQPSDGLDQLASKFFFNQLRDVAG